MTGGIAFVLPTMVFTTIVVLLCSAVLMVRRRLTQRTAVVVSINGQKRLSVQSGDALLATLAGEGIHLPGACGGRGTCGQCRVTVTGGGGRLLPTELNHINQRDAARGVRLACMVRVRQDLALQIPQDILSAERWQCRVVSNLNVSTYLTELTLALPRAGRVDFQAGDYVLLEAVPGKVRFRDFDIDADYLAEWDSHDLRRYEVDITEPVTRAYSMANSPAEGRFLQLVVRIALPPVHAPPETPPGKVSSFVFGLKSGDSVTVSGPFGEFHAREGDREMVLIGGGAGIAPLRAIIRDQLLVRKTRRRINLWYGCRNLHELVFAEEFTALAEQYENFTYHVALSEPRQENAGKRPIELATGLIHKLVYERYLHTHPAPEEAEYYLCGPPLMSSAVMAMLEDLGVDRGSVFFDDFGGGLHAG